MEASQQNDEKITQGVSTQLIKSGWNRPLPSVQQTALVLTGSAMAVYLTYKAYRLYKDRQEDDDYYSEKDEQFSKFRHLDEQFNGLLGVFSNEPECKDVRQTACMQKYYMPVGLPNLGNTCYMNALLQSLTGCSLFMDYSCKLWQNIKLIPTETDSIITFRSLALLLDLAKGTQDIVPSDLYDLLCQEFTTLYEQCDSHELLVYLQDKITKITAKHLRTMTFDEGLAASDLLSKATSASSESPLGRFEDHINYTEEEIKDDLQVVDKALMLSGSSTASDQNNHLSQQSHASGRLLKGILQIKDLSTNKKIGLNPFAGVYLSTIKCLKCGPNEELHRWEVFYDLSLEVKESIYESLEQYFRSEKIEDYTCIKCSLRTYLSQYPKDLNQIPSAELRQAVNELRKMSYIHDLDEETFVKEWKEFKQQSGNQTKLAIDKLHTQITKKFSVATPPKILCLHLKRVCYSVTGQMLLDRGFVKYPEILDLNNIPSIKQQNYEIETQYRLSAVIEHFGSAMGGHYVAYKKLFPEENTRRKSLWVKCDDSTIKIMEQKEILQRTAYMLFYERINAKKEQAL